MDEKKKPILPKNNGLARHILEVVAPPIDIARLEVLLANAFAASSVKIRATVPLRDPIPPIFGRLSKLGKRIMAVLGDGKPWRSKHVVERVAEGLKPATVRHELDVLWEEGRISKPRSGVWILAGMPEPSAGDIAPLRTEFVGGSTGRKVLGRLSGPISASALVEELGVSRQRMDQILKALLKQGKVVRTPEPGTSGRWLWMRSDVNVRASVRRHTPVLPSGRAKVLNTLEPDAFHWVGDVAIAAGQSIMAANKQTQELEARGLVISLRLGQKRYVGITPRGLEHPARIQSATRAMVANLSEAFGEKRIAFLETLAVLGEARTIDVTAALAGVERPGAGLMSGQLIAGLMKSDFAEAISGEPGTHPIYRLTEAGRLAAALVARNRNPPEREKMEQRMASFRNQRTNSLRKSGLHSRLKGD